jgi:hypothetical protein
MVVVTSTVGHPSSSPSQEGLVLTAITLAMIGLLGIGWGALHAASGRALRRHRPWSRAATLTLAMLNLVFLPFGTALGAYSLWVLLHDDVRRVFAGAPVSP